MTDEVKNVKLLLFETLAKIKAFEQDPSSVEPLFAIKCVRNTDLLPDIVKNDFAQANMVDTDEEPLVQVRFS